MVVLLGAGKPAISPLSVKPLFVSSEPTHFEYELQERSEEPSSRLDKMQFVRMREVGTPPPHSTPPPRPPDPVEETDAWCRNLRKNTAEFLADMEAFRAEMRNEFRQLRVLFNTNLQSPTMHEPQTQSPLVTTPPIQPQDTLVTLPLTHSHTSQSLLMAAQPIHEPQSPIVHSHLWKARCKQVSLKSTAPTGGVKKPRPLRLGTVAARGKYQKQNPQFHCLFSEIAHDFKVNHSFGSSVAPILLSHVISTQSNHNNPAAFGSVTGTDNNLNFMTSGCNGIDFVLGDKLAGVDVICDDEKRKSFAVKVRVQNGDGNEFRKLEGDSVKEDEHGPNLYVKGREFDALHLLDEMSESDGRRGVGRTVVAVTSIRDKGGGSATHGALSQGKAIHGYSIRRRFSDDVVLSTALLDMYAKCQYIVYARKIFDAMGVRNDVCWSAMIGAYVDCDCMKEAMSLFDDMVVRDIRNLTRVTLGSVLRAWTKLIDLSRGRRVHCYAIKAGFDLNTMVGNTILSMYAKCGITDDAFRFLDIMDPKDSVSYGAIISGYVQNGYPKAALLIFHQMQLSGIDPDLATMTGVLPACTHLAALQHGSCGHGYSIARGFVTNTSVCNALIDMYSKCGELHIGRQVFDKMLKRDTVSWNSRIVGYGIHGLGMEAILQFYNMQAAGMKPDDVTFIGLLSACSHSGLVTEGKHLFSAMTQDGSKGWINSVVASTNDKDGRTEESLESDGGPSLSYSDDSQKIGGHILTNSDGEGVTDEEWGGKDSFDYTTESVGLKVTIAPNFEVGVLNKTPEFLKMNPIGKVPVLETPDGSVFESNAIARYVARLKADTPLYGSSSIDYGHIEQWIDFATSEVDANIAGWSYPRMGFGGRPYLPPAEETSISALKRALGALNTHLASSTFLVEHSVTLADIIMTCNLSIGFTSVMTKSFTSEFPHVERYFWTMVNQPNFKKVLGEVKQTYSVVAVQSAKKPAPAKGVVKSKAEEPKKEAKKEPAKPKAEAEEEEAPKPKLWNMRFVASFLVDSYTHSGTLKHAYNIHECVIIWASMVNEDGMHGHGKEGVKGLGTYMSSLKETELSKSVYYLRKQGKSGMVDASDEYSFTAIHQLAVQSVQVLLFSSYAEVACKCLFEPQNSRSVLLICWYDYFQSIIFHGIASAAFLHREWVGLMDWKGCHGYNIDLSITAFKTCLFLVLTTWHGTIVAVCAMSLIIEIEEKLQCAALIQNVKLEDKFLLKGEGM